MTLSRVARILGLPRGTVAAYVRAHLITATVYGDGADRRYDISEMALSAFMRANPHLYDPARVTDDGRFEGTDWKAIAFDLLDAPRGRYVTAVEAGRIVGLSRDQLLKYVQEGVVRGRRHSTKTGRTAPWRLLEADVVKLRDELAAGRTLRHLVPEEGVICPRCGVRKVAEQMRKGKTDFCKECDRVRGMKVYHGRVARMRGERKGEQDVG